MGHSTLIRAGQTLLVPSRGSAGRSARDEYFAADGEATTHRVRRGETLSRIASHYGLSLDAVLKANRLANPNRLQVGQELAIPATRSAPQPAPPPAEPEAPRAEAASESLGYRVEVLAARSLSTQNNSEALGRVASTAHIVEQARQQIAAAGSPWPSCAGGTGCDRAT
jgi:LysM repeat protein